jgi:hypothetical protein
MMKRGVASIRATDGGYGPFRLQSTRIHSFFLILVVSRRHRSSALSLSKLERINLITTAFAVAVSCPL